MMNDGAADRSIPSRDNRSNSSQAYLERAAQAVEMGDGILGIHLYLAAYEQALRENLVPSDESIAGMGKAWDLAVDSKQRSLAEYIFEKLEPFWSPEEIARHAEELQRLAFDKLEEYGFDREVIEDMADMVNQDLIEGGPDVLYQFEEHLPPHVPQAAQSGVSPQPSAQASEHPSAAASVPESQQTQSSQAGAPQQQGEFQQSPAGAAPAAPQQPVAPQQGQVQEEHMSPMKALAALGLVPVEPQQQEAEPQQRFDYTMLVGFDGAIKQMAGLGVGRSREPEFARFVEMLNKRHGLPGIPGLGTVLFSSPSREDANYFMVATVGELRIPAIRMRLDHNAQGQSILCVMASPDFKTRLAGLSRSGFDSPTAVILEDLDLWDLPFVDPSVEDPQSFIQMQLSRGAREALALINVALGSPEATVLISSAEPEEIDPYFWDLIGDYSLVEIDLPDSSERAELWRYAEHEHPSMRGLDLGQLVEFSNSLSRYEIMAVANEAVEDAYRESLSRNRFCAVRTEDMIGRLADFQPLDSQEYKRMEDMAVEALRRSTSNFDDLLE